MMKNWIKLMMLLVLLTAGCKTTKFQDLNGVSTLIAHPQFQNAATNAPAFTKAALNEVARLNKIIRLK